MSSTDRVGETAPLSRRHHRQSGQTLVEALVASMVVGIAVAAGIVTLNATVIGARQVAIQAWAECMQRGQAEAVVAAGWSDTGGYPAPSGVSVQVAPVAGQAGVQKITVGVANPSTGAGLAKVPPVVLYKARVLSPQTGSYDPAAITAGCQSVLRGGP